MYIPYNIISYLTWKNNQIKEMENKIYKEKLQKCIEYDMRIAEKYQELYLK